MLIRQEMRRMRRAWLRDDEFAGSAASNATSNTFRASIIFFISIIAMPPRAWYFFCQE